MSRPAIRQKPIHRGRIPTPGGVVYAASPAQADVADAVAAANPGDTVYVPAGDGTETWTAGVTLTRGLNIVGPGAANLTLSAATATFFTAAPNATALANNEAFRITGFTFDGQGRTGSEQYGIRAVGPTTAPILNKFILGDCAFANFATRTWRADGQVRGVVYGNTFTDCDTVFSSEGGNVEAIWDEFGPYRGYGLADSGDSLYFEDNTITCTAGWHGSGGCTTGQAGRGVIRYNTWDLSLAADNDEYWDVHGAQYFPLSNASYSTMQVEYYGNTMAVVGPYLWSRVRGGWVLMFNNIMTGSTVDISVNDYEGSCDTLYTSRPMQLDNAYFWNNTSNGTVRNAWVSKNTADTYGSGTPAVPCTHQPLVENSRFYNYNASFDGTTQHGIGRGTNISSAPASCNNVPTTDLNGQAIRGDAFWVASTETPTVDSAVIQAGKLYKFIDGAWAVYYEPYTYPHPLRGGE